MEQETDATSVPRCANPDCRIAETGRCVEGLPLDTCTYYGRVPEASAAGEAQAEHLDESIVRLRPATTLTSVGASRVRRAGESRVVAIVGSSDSGKTSLIASLYDLFQLGEVAGIEFCRSESLHAFEQACHDARAASRRNVAHMNRTPRGEVRFYHLQVDGNALKNNVSLLLGDRAGEEYREAADDADNAKAFFEIARADSISILVDGHRLTSSGRHNLRNEVLMMLQGLHDGGVIRRGTNFAFVVTKMDEVLSAEDPDSALRFFDRLVDDARRIFSRTLHEARVFKVAASPKSDTARRGEGVSDLLQFWLEESLAEPALHQKVPEPRRAFEKLMGADEGNANRGRG
jgi:hypothetical protein